MNEGIILLNLNNMKSVYVFQLISKIILIEVLICFSTYFQNNSKKLPIKNWIIVPTKK